MPALTSKDERHLDHELAFARARRQVAVVRTLLDELERMARPSERANDLLAQLVEELAKVGCQVFEATASLARTHESVTLAAAFPRSSRASSHDARMTEKGHGLSRY